ncbi:hypothetical protein ATANTOWER_032206 [Ataeniobius toweri]|uniref:Uncharacterized protein n=1 Tax=Ataeniobius toweri TaxID=208326 RepID=A0ABU7BMI2_9TELE|nr:hypothetical protein [Ataeniobius toweri]
MVIDFTKKALPDSFALFYDVKGLIPGHKLTAAAMASTTDSREESDVSLDIFQSLSEKEEAVRRRKSAFIRWQGRAGVNMQESYRTTRKQNEHNIWIFQIIY